MIYCIVVLGIIGAIVPGLSLLWAYPVRRGVLTHNYACHIDVDAPSML